MFTHEATAIESFPLNLRSTRQQLSWHINDKNLNEPSEQEIC